MKELFLFLAYFGLILSILYSLITLLLNKFKSISKILMLFCVLACTIPLFFWTFFQGSLPLKNQAHLWVISFPFFFFAGSLLYLYVKSVLRNTKVFNKWELMHLIPVLIHFIELTPFYLLPSKAKKESLSLYILHPEKTSEMSIFLFSMNTHLYFKGVFWMFYLFITFRLLFTFKKENASWITKNTHIWFWVIRLTVINASSLLLYIIGFIFIDSFILTKALALPNLFLVLASVIVLMFSPKVLYGYKSHIPSKKISKLKSFELTSVKIEEYKKKIELLINDKNVYLIKNYSIKDMSNDLDIPVHHLSIVINNELSTNYASYINKCRINYIIEHRYDKEWINFSYEGMAKEAGFNSRNSFYKAFKKATGLTPSKYFENEKKYKI